ncbi:uncharacterized protein MYCFIDRAFT_202689 [Pseudocercospora fijiensis CIRAD86]|uniref:Uncharacterized protein n=1 Tax=Pseudocercospora fijiensis (strain CIRAD86) TaxID=383855 RepID=M3AQK4_PSEFD|nr:uncharacterized protein MYCFIDRAFT_202689 [Pseudocercospora fijiensis CIRAD86]EME86891.1 hypothetical protein MYCFIDRAFT_202689 [Pseudocercospora fijiensis CIRAD86]
MPPDLNSLPTSRPSSMPGSPLSQRPRRISISTGTDAARPSPPSPRSPSLSSLQAAATINAGLHHSPSRASPSVERRRSSLMNNLTLNDPTVPAPGEMQQSSPSTAGSRRMSRRSFALNTADPHHPRQPSLGELHQELENEQEAQVNRLLHMIRVQQDQLAAMQRQQNSPVDSSPTTADNTTAAATPSTLATPAGTAVTEASSPHSNSTTAAAAAHPHFNRPHSLSRRSSALISTPGSRGTSPALRPQNGSLGPLTEDFLLGGTRDETAFYQAETQTLTRENQMLKLRIRELERQISEMGGASSSATQQSLAASQTHQHSPLTSPPATFAAESVTVPAEVEATAKVD